MRLRTELAGLFYLVNLGLFLELYGDFTTPLRPGLALPLWDFVTLVGRGLLGGQPEDPVWDLLADLAGREAGAAPGEGFDPEDAWRVPAAWLRPFGEGHAFGWSAQGGRLSAWHPEGFALIDVALEDAVDRQLAAEMDPYARFGAPAHEGADPAPAHGPPIDRWLGRLLPYVRARLARALGVEPGDVASTVLVSPGQVVLDAERLDVSLSLSRLPIEVRLSGLDRDPGWVPAAGRWIAFHFE